MKHSLFKRVLSLVMCLLMVVTMVPLSSSMLLVSAQSSELDPICDHVSSFRWQQLEDFGFWMDQSKKCRDLVHVIKYGETYADICFDTATTMIFTLIPLQEQLTAG